MTIVTFDRITTAECHYARKPVAPYGTTGKGPRPQRLQLKAHTALEAAIRELGEIHPWGPPRYLVSAGAMVGQSKRRGPTDPHVRGLAYDIDSIWWAAPGDQIVALGAPRGWRHYISIQCILARWFGTVLGYDYNADHLDHWHCDVTRPVKWDAGSRMDVLLLQRALVEVWGCDLVVDGIYGPKTMSAWRDHTALDLLGWREWLLATARRGLKDL